MTLSLLSFPAGEKDVRALLVRCDNHDTGDTADTCDWTGELGDLEYHLSSCPLEAVPCPNKCHSNGGGGGEDGTEPVKIRRRHLQAHLSDECPNRPHTCPHCRQTGTYAEMQGPHVGECMKRPIQCPNTPCPFQVTRETLREHNRSQCLYATDVCCHSDVGCSARLMRVKLREHEADASSHLETARFMIASLKKQVAELKAGLSKMEERAKKELSTARERTDLLTRGQTVFKIADFSLYRSGSREFRSKPFFTRHHGYKMCIIVEANGAAKVKGTYVSVYAHLMRGEHDDALPWPMAGTVTFELLNQVGNHGHRKRSCTFPPDDKDNRRVIGQEIADTGYGCPKFVSHAKLEQGEGKEVQYLKDDAVYLRVSVEVQDPPDFDWLKCY